MSTPVYNQLARDWVAAALAERTQVLFTVEAVAAVTIEIPPAVLPPLPRTGDAPAGYYGARRSRPLFYTGSRRAPSDGGGEVACLLVLGLAMIGTLGVWLSM